MVAMPITQEQLSAIVPVTTADGWYADNAGAVIGVATTGIQYLIDKTN
jgi:hypothetical protein